METGWLIESTNTTVPFYAYADIGQFSWTTYANQALRFARKTDAEQFGSVIRSSMEWEAREHSWCPPPRPMSTPAYCPTCKGACRATPKKWFRYDKRAFLANTTEETVRANDSTEKPDEAVSIRADAEEALHRAPQAEGRRRNA